MYVQLTLGNNAQACCFTAEKETDEIEQQQTNWDAATIDG